jgi:urea transport system permease protein
MMTLAKWGVGLSLCLSLLSGQAYALTANTVQALSMGDTDARIAMLNQVTAQENTGILSFLQALLDDRIKIIAGKQVVLLSGDTAVDAVTNTPVTLPDDAEDVVNNNRMRGELQTVIAGLQLSSPDRKTRLAAVEVLRDADLDTARLGLIKQAEAVEKDPEINELLARIRARLELSSPDKATRISAATLLGMSDRAEIKQLLVDHLSSGNEKDVEVIKVVKKAIVSIDNRIARYEIYGKIFSGISLGSILLLAALGLAITYGLMGVINMAHGEMIMLGAYTTYMIQRAMQHYWPSAIEGYIIVAIPFAFVVAALMGMLLERLVIRHLYGRPLETLLATWGISLILMQLVRNIFGAQNVMVENPQWLSGGLVVASNLVLPYNRIAIIGFAFFVLFLVWLILVRTRLGLFLRAVTQNRRMAGCVGVNTAKVDTFAFGIGSGIAGLAGLALSQIGNVGPDLGTNYIVDSFMVVVLGGVGQLIGTVYSAIGLGMVDKLLEGYAGAVMAKIIVLVMIIIIIQKRPQGLFALKGRSTDA